MIMWLDEHSGTGYGVCAVAGMFMQGMMKPTQWNEEAQKFDDDWPSIVAVIGPQEKYTSEEIAALEEFGDKMTAKYDEHFRWRMGCNLIIINKYGDNEWMRKRQSWEYGPMFSETLDEAMAIFE